MDEIKTKYILVGGMISAMISIIPVVNLINCFCCIGIIAGGYVAVYFYHRDGHGLLTMADGALMGVLAGLVAALVDTSVELFFIQFLGGNPNLTLLMQFAEDLARELNDPALNEQLQTLKDAQMTQQYGILDIMQSLIVSSIIYGLFSMLGALIRTSQENNKKKDSVLPPSNELNG